MKLFVKLIVVFACLVVNVVDAQIVSLSYPINNSVIQRGTLNTATVTIAGQLISGDLTGTVKYRFRPVNASGVAGAPGPAAAITLAPNGMFYVSPIVSKGWYLCEILLNGVVYTNAKFGVGDVFIIAGQSNAQGYKNEFYLLPSSANIPEWIIGTYEDRTCTKKLPQTFNTLFSLNTLDEGRRHGPLGPTGNSIWAYAVLGKLISEANGGMPVAFFNAASGGTTVTQWKQGSEGVEAKHPNTNAQMCVGYMEGSAVPSDYYGQPYTPLKNALNFYGSLFGVRAVLWHQGEADSDPTINPIYQASSSADYQAKLQAVIAKSRADFGAPNLTWYISKASISEFGPVNPTVRAGQGIVVSGPLNLSGPDTDYINGSSGAMTASDGGDEYRGDKTHFYEGPGSIKGLTWLANKWYSTIAGLTNPVAASFVPLLNYSKNADWRTLTAPSGGVQYHWNSTHINNAGVAGGTSSVFTTDQKWLGIRCYMKDAIGKWHISATINMGQYNTQREGTEEKQNDQPGFELNTYPNPYSDDFTVAFDVPDNNSQVRLDIIDNHGQILRTVVNNSHAKGKWEYPVNELVNNNNTENLFCRLRINENYTVKKLVHLTK